MTTSPDPSTRANRRRWPWALFGLGLLLSAGTGSALGYFMRFDLPDVRKLADYNPPQMTRVLAADGTEIDSFAEQRRILIEYREIPSIFRQALVATEDVNFERHTGIDFKALIRAAWSDLRSLRLAQGASTLTQQLARNLFLHPDKTIRRKIQEAFLAIEIERQYTKQEILRFYTNQIYMGHGRYGLEAASRFYFDTPARDLNLTEAATLVGLIQRPEALSPLRNPERAKERRDRVLRRMAEVGFLTSEQARAAQAEPLATRGRVGRSHLAPYFVEDVRRWLQDKYGSTGLYQEGLEVATTVDPRLQELANAAVDRGLRALDRRQGWRGATGRVPDGADPASFAPPTWTAGLGLGAVHDAVVLRVTGDAAAIRIGPYSGSLTREAIAWTGQTDPRRLLKPGDLVRARLESIESDGAARVTLEQEPRVEAALVAIDPASGAIRALVGGFDFGRSEYDRATQARRQTGSAFKPFVYAAALAHGWTASDTLLDEPTVFLDPRNPQPYQPENYKHDYHGAVTLRTALESSANIATVRLLDQLGYDAVIDTARRLGLGRNLQPYPSLALGAFEATLLELTAAYAAFANQGVAVRPYFVSEVRDRDGLVIARHETEAREALPPQIAYLMTRLLSGVISDGTGRAAASLGLPLAGKTGTTDENTDAWFIGYSADLAVGVWVGFDEPRSLGSRETGAQAALPIWLEFMRGAELAAVEFPMPPGVTIATIDRATGLKAHRDARCAQPIAEAYLAGTEPTRYCTAAQHARLALPYPFHRYPLNDRGELAVPADELDALLAREHSVGLVGTELVAASGARLRLEFLPPSGALAAGADPRLASFETSSWRGQDGRPASVVWVDGRGSPR